MSQQSGFDYRGKFALITGTSKRVGKAYPEELAARGSGVHVMVANSGATATELFEQSPTAMKRDTTDTAESVAHNTLYDLPRGKVVSYPGTAFAQRPVCHACFLGLSLQSSPPGFPSVCALTADVCR